MADDSVTVYLYVDGGCMPNPGRGAWAAVLMYGAHVRELSGSEPDTTNNRMELTAVIEGLRALKRPCQVVITSDSMYVVNGGSGRNKNSSNLDLWEQLQFAALPHTLEWQWVRGHDGNTLNERCHALVTRELNRRAA